VVIFYHSCAKIGKVKEENQTIKKLLKKRVQKAKGKWVEEFL